MNEILDQIVTLLNTHVKTPRGIKAIFKGDRLNIPEVDLPAIAVSPSSGETRTGDSRRDFDVLEVIITVILLDQTYVESGVNDEHSALWELQKIMEEKASGKIKADTILGVIRKELYDDATLTVKTESERRNYGFAEGRGYPTVEATLTFQVHTKYYDRD